MQYKIDSLEQLDQLLVDPQFDIWRRGDRLRYRRWLGT